MKYLVQTTEIYRVDTETEVATMIEEAKNSDTFTLLKYNCETKDVKIKGEIVDTYFKLSLTKGFNSIKEPDTDIDIIYEVN